MDLRWLAGGPLPRRLAFLSRLVPGRERQALQWGLVFLSYLAFAWMYGPLNGLGATLALYLHEMGHYVALVSRGVPHGGIFLIPFLGGVIVAPPGKLKDEVPIALAGPIFGFMGCLFSGLAAHFTGWSWLWFMTQWAAFINLMNLIPIFPLDGGRTVRAIVMTKVTTDLASLQRLQLCAAIVTALTFMFVGGPVLFPALACYLGLSQLRLAHPVAIASRLTMQEANEFLGQYLVTVSLFLLVLVAAAIKL